MQIKHSKEKNKGAFTAYFNEIETGKMTYTWTGNSKFSIDHTEVNPEFGGQGIGKKLVLHAVNFAREKDAKIKPLCTYAKAVFDKTPDIQDVLE